MESLGFLDALNSAPVPGNKIKKKKPKVASPTNNKVESRHMFFLMELITIIKVNARQ